MTNEIRITKRQTEAVIPAGFVFLSTFVIGISSYRGGGFFEFLDDLENAVAAHDGVVHDELEGRGVFEDHGTGDQPLDALPMVGEQGEATLLLVGITQNADEDDGGVE